MDPLIRLVRAYQRCQQAARKLRISGKLLRKIGPNLDRYIRSRYRGSAREDIYQETLWAIAEGLDDFKGKTDKGFMKWCFGIARHKVVDELRKGGRDKTVSLNDGEVWRAIESLNSEEPLSAQDRLTLKECMQAVAVVKPPCFDFLLSRYIDGLDYETIGNEHGISARGAWLAVDRCARLARKLLGE